MANIFDVAASFRGDLAAMDQAAANRLVDAYGSTWKRVDGELNALVSLMEATDKDDWSPSWLMRQERYMRLQQQLEQGLAEYVPAASKWVTGSQVSAIAAAEAHADVLTKLSLGKPPKAVHLSLAKLPADAVTDLLGTTGAGSPLFGLLGEAGDKARRQVTRELLTGMAMGLNPRRIAANAKHAVAGGLGRSLTIARTEVLRAYRETTRRSYKANDDVLDGWVWQSRLSTRTCASCWAMHGSVHTTNDRLDDHPNGRCAMVPRTKSWAELGYPGVPETRVPFTRGPDAFAQLSPGEQLKVLGPLKFAKYQDGDLELGALVGMRTDAQWGSMRYERSWKAIADGKGDGAPPLAYTDDLAPGQALSPYAGQQEALDVAAKVGNAAVAELKPLPAPQAQVVDDMLAEYDYDELTDLVAEVTQEAGPGSQTLANLKAAHAQSAAAKANAPTWAAPQASKAKVGPWVDTPDELADLAATKQPGWLQELIDHPDSTTELVDQAYDALALQAKVKAAPKPVPMSKAGNPKAYVKGVDPDLDAVVAAKGHKSYAKLDAGQLETVVASPAATGNMKAAAQKALDGKAPTPGALPSFLDEGGPVPDPDSVAKFLDAMDLDDTNAYLAKFDTPDASPMTQQFVVDAKAAKSILVDDEWIAYLEHQVDVFQELGLPDSMAEAVAQVQKAKALKAAKGVKVDAPPATKLADLDLPEPTQSTIDGLDQWAEQFTASDIADDLDQHLFDIEDLLAKGEPVPDAMLQAHADWLAVLEHKVKHNVVTDKVGDSGTILAKAAKDWGIDADAPPKYVPKPDGDLPVPAHLAPDAPDLAPKLVDVPPRTDLDLNDEPMPFAPDELKRAPSSEQVTGGMHTKEVLEAPDGTLWLWKPQDEYRATLDAATARLQRLSGLTSTPTYVTRYGGRTGSLQRLHGRSDQRRPRFRDDNYDPLRADVKMNQDLQESAVFDWLVSNHDAHEGQFLRLSGSMDTIEVDLGQAFRYFGTDRLDYTYKPNSKYGVDSVYNKLHKAWAEGKSPSGFQSLAQGGEGADQLRSFIRQVQGIPDDVLRDTLRPYATQAARQRTLATGSDLANDVDAFLDAVVERKRQLLVDWEDYHRRLAEQRVQLLPKAPDGLRGLGAGWRQTDEKWARTVWTAADDAALDRKQRSALSTYTGSGYHRMNDQLRRSKGRDTDGTIDALQDVLEAKPIPEAVVVHRGTGLTAFDRPPGELAGTVQVDHGFGSTSVGGSAAFGHQPAILELYVPEGTVGRYVAKVSNHKAERELLLGRGWTYYVHEVEQRGNRWHVKAELLPPGADPSDLVEPSMIDSRYVR